MTGRLTRKDLACVYSELEEDGFVMFISLFQFTNHAHLFPVILRVRPLLAVILLNEKVELSFSFRARKRSVISRIVKAALISKEFLLEVEKPLEYLVLLQNSGEL